ncbi:hypothetical protein BDF19DRAFT_423267 [Syncephalis fuscata]|nr:hypothetical protein BDF19DRAFT_423267 [Syncephalis fuscata]
MSNSFVPTTGCEPSFTNRWLIVPAVSIGGIPQLTADLLITTLQLKRVGHLNDPNVLPIACVDPCALGQTGITTALEVLQSDNEHFTVIQQRSPELPVIKWPIQGILLLSSLDITYRADIREPGKDFRYVTVHGDHESLKPLLHQATTASITPLESIIHEDDAALADQITALHEIPMMHGAGVSRRLLVTARDQPLPVLDLCLYTAEGDNTQNALKMADKVAQLLSLSGVSTNNEGKLPTL